MKKYLFFLLISAQLAVAQKQGQARIDSLLRAIPETSNDTLKARLYNQVVNEYFFINTQKALKYSQIGLAHVRKMRWTKGIGVFLANIGQAYSDQGLYDSCSRYYQQAVAIYRKIDDKRNLASTLNNLGAAESNIKSDYVKSTQYYLQALKEAEAIPDTFLIGLCYRNISNIYAEQSNFPKALQYARRGLRMAEMRNLNPNNNNSREVAWALSRVANVYLKTADYRTANTYLNKSLSLFETLGDVEGMATIYDDLAITADTNYTQKLQYAQKALALWEQINPMHSEAIASTGNLGMAYFDYVKYRKPNNKADLLRQAEKYFKLAFERSKQKGEIANEAYWQGALAELQAMTGDYKNAYLNFRSFQAVQDSLFSQKSKNQIAELEGNREISIRDKQLQINQLKIESQRKQGLGLVVGIVLLLIIGGLLYWQNLTRKRTNTTLLYLNNELDEANKVKAKFFAILSHDLRSPIANLVNFLHLQREAPELLSPDMTQQHQQRITDAAEGLLDTMESMLLWSKGQMQAFEPKVRRIEVADLFEYLQRFFASTTGISLTFENPDSLQLVTDEDYLRTIMQNLTANAIKALRDTPNASVHWLATQESGQVVLSVSDNGPGVNQQQLTALYDEHSSIGLSTGLGLHLIRDLAKAIACRISVQSVPKQGTEFRLIFAIN